jgi:transposase-like protein
LDEVVRQSVETTLNGLLDAEADQLCRAGRYERSAERVDTRAGTYERRLQTKAGQVTLKVPRLRSLPFETQIIERYRRRESSVEEALMEMYLAGVSVRRVEDITEALWGTRVSPSTVSELNQQLYERIEAWRNAPLTGQFAYVSLDGIWLKRSWGGEVKKVAVLVAIGVDQDGYRQVLGVVEGTKEDAESWRNFLRHLKERGLAGVRLVTSDKCLGLVETLGEFYPEADWQRCMVHWYRNVLSVTPTSKSREVVAMLKAIHAQEDREAAEKKAADVVVKLQELKLGKAAKIVAEGVNETLSYMAYPREHWTRIRTNNPLERIMREIRRRTRVVGAFPDGRSALMLVAARLRHVAGSRWGTRKYLDMERLRDQSREEAPEAVA